MGLIRLCKFYFDIFIIISFQDQQKNALGNTHVVVASLSNYKASNADMEITESR